MLLDSGFQQCSILGFHVQRLLYPLAGTFHLQLPSWTKWLAAAALQLKLSLLDLLTCPNGPRDGPLPTIPLLFHDVTIGMDPQRTPFPAVLPLVTLHGMTYSIVASLFIVSQMSLMINRFRFTADMPQYFYTAFVWKVFSFPSTAMSVSKLDSVSASFTTLLILKWCSTSLKIWAVTESTRSNCTSCKVTTLLTANCVLDTSPEEGVHCDKWGLHIESSPPTFQSIGQ
jgi:hypothetical protein